MHCFIVDATFCNIFMLPSSVVTSRPLNDRFPIYQFRLVQSSTTHPIFGTNLLRIWITLSSFDEISLLFETTHQHFRPRYVVLAIAESSRTITKFHQNDDNVIQAMRTFQPIRQNCQPLIQVEILEQMYEMYAWLG